MLNSEPTQEKPNPFTTANPISKIFFSWCSPFFKKVYKTKKLPTQDLYGVLHHDSSEYCGDQIEKEWKKELHKTHPSLPKALIRAYGLFYAFMGIFAFLEESIRVAQPILLGYLIDYFSPDPQTTFEPWQAYLYATGVSLLAFLLATVHAPYFFTVTHLGMQIRVGLCTVVYRKMLKLSNTSLRETSGGQINNFMTNDVNRFDRIFIFLHHLWLGPLQVVIVGYLLYLEIKWAFVPGYFVLFLLMPTQAILGRLFGVLRRKTAAYTDQRVGIMSEIIMAMRVIKMYAWEQPFEMVVRRVRKSEIARILLTSYPLVFNMTLYIYGNRLIDVFMIITYGITTTHFRASSVFVVVAFCTTLRSSFMRKFAQGVQLIYESRVTCQRIQTFLLLDELDSVQRVENEDKTDKEEGDHGVTAVNLQGSWEVDKNNPILQFLNFEVPKGNVMAVIGPVGSGKSSLLMALLKELPTISGKASVRGRISYVSQEPWVFNGTVRQNILFELTYDKDKYNRIVRVCALDKDIVQLADGDMTMVGERGVTLSGGQKARVNLARALYDDGDVYLLDDPLSAVDSEVGRHIFDRCIMGYLADKPRILVTHQLQFLSAAHQILVLKEGRQEAIGTLNELQSQGIDFAKLLKEDDEEEEDDDGLIRSPSQRSRAGSRLSSVGSIKQKKEQESAKIFKAEETKKGDVGWSIYLKYFRSGTNVCGCIILLFFLLGAQVAYILADYWLAYWSDSEEAARLVPVTTSMAWTSATTSTDMMPTTSIPDGDKFVLTTEESAFVYGFFVAVLLIMGLIRAFLAFRVMIRASKNLHYDMFKSVVRSPVLFFDTNPTGRILNRFTKDIGLMDDQLPTTFFDFIQLALSILGVIIVNIIVNPFSILLALPLAIVFVLLRRYALVTTRQVKRLDGVTRSPVFSHTTSSLKGLWVIRSYQKQDEFNAEFCKHQDLHTEAWFMFLATSRWFGIRLDLIMVIFTAGITFAAVPLAGNLDAGLVGLILSNTLSLTNVFQFCVRQSALVENQMTSVERVFEYCKLESEAPLDIPKNKPAATWPQSGNIAFKNMSLAYSQEMPIVLKNINCQIQAKEKIGVVGRTGAGKSSLITALFRLAEPHGAVVIDGIQTSSLGLHDLRKKLSIIPQDPVLFTGTLRYNLDPFDEHKDNNLWKALDEVQLHHIVKESPEKLEMEVGEGGSNFSVGQRQLICLARAILKHNRILILDEATANVDPRTDALIQETIRTKFQDCTVVTIAHRLNTIMDSDRIMVLDNGELKEFDQPYTLLQDKTSMLSKLVEQTGKGVATQLLEVAQTHYHNQQQQTETGLVNGNAGYPNHRSHESLQYGHQSSPDSEMTLTETDKIKVDIDDSTVDSATNSNNQIDSTERTALQKVSKQQQTEDDNEETMAFDNVGFEEDEKSAVHEEGDAQGNGSEESGSICSDDSDDKTTAL